LEAAAAAAAADLNAGGLEQQHLLLQPEQEQEQEGEVGSEEDWEREDEAQEEAEQRKRSDRRGRNREAAQRYRQRQRQQEHQLAVQLAASQAQRAELLAERQQLNTQQEALLKMEAVQFDMHRQIVQLCSPEGPALAAAQHSAAAMAAAMTSQQAADKARLVAALEEDFASELRSVVFAGSPAAAAEAALRLLPPSCHSALDAPATIFVQQCVQLQGQIHELITASQQRQQQQQQGAAQPPAGGGGSGIGGAAGEASLAAQADETIVAALDHCAVLVRR
jgi:hypothetical protein